MGNLSVGVRGSSRGVSFSLLFVFRCVAEAGSLSGAARRLDMSVSSVSRDLNILERALGVRLFERSTRSLALTEAGEKALRWADDALGAYEGISDELANLTGRAAGAIKLVANHYAAVTYIPAILTSFCLQYPEITVSMRTTDGNVDIISEGVDVMVHSGRPISDQVVGVRIDESHRILCATPDYLDRFDTPKSPADLVRHRILVHSTNEAHAWGFRRGKQLVVTPIKPYISVDNHLVLRDLVRGGAGIGRLGRVLVDEDLSGGRLRQLLPRFTTAYAPGGDLASLWVFYPSRHLVLRTRVFVEFLIQALRNRQALDRP